MTKNKNKYIKSENPPPSQVIIIIIILILYHVFIMENDLFLIGVYPSGDRRKGGEHSG